MARKAILTDGTRTVDLIDIDTIIPQRGAFGKSKYAPHQYDAARVVNDMLFVETWRMNIYGTSHDNLATQTALFKALLRDAWRYHKAEFDKPVYLEVRTDAETNTRFATVWMCPEISDPDLFTHPFALDNAIEGQGVNIARFAWESLPQGIKGNRLLQTASIGPDYSPDTTDYDVDLTAEDGQLPVTMTGGLIGRPGDFGRAVQVAEATINHVLNPSAEAAGNFAAVGGTAAQSIEQAMFGTNSYKVVTRAVANDGMTLTLNALANAIHYVTIRSYTALTDWEWSLNGGGVWNAMATIGTEDGWFVYGFQFPAVEANASALLELRHTPASIVTVYLDAAQAEELDYPTCYCDGSLGPGHAWAGAVHASTSTRTAHVLRYTISDVSLKGTIHARPMAIYEEDEKTANAYVFSLSDGTANNVLSMWLDAANNIYKVTYTGNAAGVTGNLGAGDIVRLVEEGVVITWDTVADELKIFVDGAQIGATVTGLTAPAAAWDRLYIGADQAGANLWTGWENDLFLLDGVVLANTEVSLLHASGKKFTGHKATDLYLDFDGPKFNHLANFRDDIAIDEIWQFDSVAGWTDIGPANNEFTWFPAAIAQNDALYWGSTDNAFKHITGFFRTAGALTTTDLVLEYSSGPNPGDYTALVFGTDYTLYSAADLETFCERTGNYATNIKPPTDWEANDPGSGVAALYVRLRENDNSPPVWPTKPIHAGQGTFTPRDNYIEVPSTVLGGDAKAKLLLRNRTPSGGDENENFASASRILIGAKENPGTFVMSLNGGADNPAGWAITNLIADTTTVADTESPGGSRCHVTFATATVMSARLRLTGTNKLADWIGEYRPMLRCQQVGGDAGDISVQLRVLIGSTGDYAPKFETKIIDLEGVDEGHEQVALSTNEPGGTLKIPWIETRTADNLDNIDVYFEILASRAAGASVLHIYCLDLLPVKPWSVELDDPLGDRVSGNTALRGDNCIDIDAGLIADRTGKMINALAAPVPVETWTRGGPPPQLNPETQVKLYFVNMHYPTTWGTGPLIATLGMHLTAEIFAHNQYYALRGND